MEVTKVLLREELANLFEQLDELRKTINHNNSLNRISELNYRNHSLDDFYYRLFGTQNVKRIGLIKLVGRKDKIYYVTDKGYQLDEAIIIDNEIDVQNSLDEYLRGIDVCVGGEE